MEYSKFFLVLFFVGKGFSFILNQLLEFVDYRHRINHGMEIPPEIQGYVDKLKLEQTCAYEDSKYFLWIIRNVVETIVSLIVVLYVYAYAQQFSWIWTLNAYLTNLLFALFISLPIAIIDIPFDLIQEFVIEKNYGFSKMTAKIWFFDQLKSLVLTLVIAVPLICVATALLIHVPRGWWALLAAVYVVFSVVVSYLYPMVIAPLFNKFTPLESGELKNRLEKLLRKSGFSSNGIYVMDASKRSGHSNAYFTGLGKSKRIVLYDTLIKQLTPDEIEAVIGHELGHYVNHHNIVHMAVTIPLVFIVLLILNLLVWRTDLYQSFHLIPHDEYIMDVLETHVIPDGYEHFFSTFRFMGIILSFTIFEGFLPLVNLVRNLFSRRNEFQADLYSAEILNNAKTLCTALIKMNKENLSEFTPPRFYCIFNYSHPPLLERIEALKTFVPKEMPPEEKGFYISEKDLEEIPEKRGLLESAKQWLSLKKK